MFSQLSFFLVSGSGNSERLPGAHQHDGTLPARARGNANALIGNATKRRLPGGSPTQCFFFGKGKALEDYRIHVYPGSPRPFKK